MLSLTGKAVALSVVSAKVAFAAKENSSNHFGSVVGEPAAAKIGESILSNGGNAIDAAVATAFAAGITSPSKCGIGGYGGHAIIALANGKITAIDFNSAAPAAAREDMFPLDAKGRVKGNLNYHGWLAAAVPGTAAGLQLALDRYGSRPLREVLAPTVHLCEEGVAPPVETRAQAALDASRNNPSPDSSRPAPAAGKIKNVPLTQMFRTLAERNSVDSFYRGDIARKIAAAFQKNGGWVTAEDLAAYQAREVKPLALDWNGLTVHTAPLTSPGLMMLEAMAILKSLGWSKLPARERLHAKLEALRIAWADRIQFFGDPDKVHVPIDRLLSSSHADEKRAKVQRALQEGRPVPLQIDSSDDEGTVHISAVDRHGNMMAVTLTHGSSFGARVSVEELGMVLGHGMWRFDPRPGHPNSPGSGKRAVNNMCPAVVTRGAKPLLAVGGAGGTRIPNSVFEVLASYVGLGATMDEAMNAPRLQTTGTLKLGLEQGHSAGDEAFLKKLGYNLSKGPSAYVSAVSLDGKSGNPRGLSSGGI